MLLKAVVHPKSISRQDKLYDPKIDIAVEELEKAAFRNKMIGLPVTMYHHDTEKAAQIIKASGGQLNGANMKLALNHLHKHQPTAKTLTAQKLQHDQKPATLKNEVSLMLYDHASIIDKAGGKGVLGTVTDFFRENDAWCVNIEMDNNVVPEILRQQMQPGGRLGDISLTHVMENNEVIPLEVSFTKQGLRSGSTISEIIMASRNKQLSQHVDVMEPVPAPTATSELERVMQFYTSLAAHDPDGALGLQTKFTETVELIQASTIKNRPVVKKELSDEDIELRKKVQEQEEAIKLLAEATGHCLKESGLGGVGLLRERTTEEWTKAPKDLMAATQMVMASLATNHRKRKNEDHNFDRMLRKAGLSGTGNMFLSANVEPAVAPAATLVRASNAKQSLAPAMVGETGGDDFAAQLRHMRKQHAANIPY